MLIELTLGKFIFICIVYFVANWIGFWLGRATKKPPEPKVGTVDELVQSMHDKIGIKTGRDVKVDVAGITCYTAIVTENSVVFVNMDYHEFN